MSKHYRHKPKKIQEYNRPPISDSAEIDNEITLGASESPHAVINYNTYLMAGSTNTSNLVDEDDDGEVPKEWPSFVDKLLQGDIRPSPRSIVIIVTIIWFGICSWLYIADNQIGRLDTPDGLRWFYIKASGYSAFYAITLIFIVLATFIQNKSPTKKEQ